MPTPAVKASHQGCPDDDGRQVEGDRERSQAVLRDMQGLDLRGDSGASSAGGGCGLAAASFDRIQGRALHLRCAGVAGECDRGDALHS